MAAVIKQFLVGVGLDTSNFDKGSKTVETSLGRFRSLAGIAGTAIVGAMGVASAAAIAAGTRIDKLVLSTEKFNTSSKFVYDYGNALKTLGGDASEAVSAIGAAEKALDELKLKGSFSAFEGAVFAGVDTQPLTQAQSGEEFLRLLSDMVPKLNEAQQRVLQESFGFSDATMRSLREGSQRFDEMVARAAKLAGGFDEAVEAARAYNKELAETQLRMEGISNILAGSMLDSFTNILKTFNNFFDLNKDRIEPAVKFAGENPLGTGLLAGGLAASGLGATATVAGFPAAGAALSRFGTPGAIAGAGILAGAPLYDYAMDDISSPEVKKQRLKESYAGIASAAQTSRETADMSVRDQMQGFRNKYLSFLPDFGKKPIQNNLNVKVELDGKPIRAIVTQEMELNNQNTIDDMKSTTAR